MAQGGGRSSTTPTPKDRGSPKEKGRSPLGGRLDPKMHLQQKTGPSRKPAYAKPSHERLRHSPPLTAPLLPTRIPAIKPHSTLVPLPICKDQSTTPRSHPLDIPFLHQEPNGPNNNPDRRSPRPSPGVEQYGSEKPTNGLYLWGMLCFASPDSSPSGIPKMDPNITVTFRLIRT